MSKHRKFPYQSLRWTSREEVCADLYRFVQETPPGDSYDIPWKPAHRVRAGELLALLDPAPGSPYRMALLRRPDEEPWLHRIALEALLLSDAVLAAEDLLFLLRPKSEHFFHGEVLNLCRSGELLEAVRDWVEPKTAEECCALLHYLLTPGSHAWGWPWWGRDHQPPQEVVDLLYERVFRSGAEPVADLYTTAMMAHRNEAREALGRLAAERQIWTTDSLLHFFHWHSEHLEGLLAAGAPELRDFPLELLRFPGWRGTRPTLAVVPLIRHYGAGEVLLYLEERLRHPTPGEPYRAFLGGANVLLTEFPEGEADDFLTSLLGCPDVSEEVKRELREVLWERLWRFSRDQVSEQLQAAVGQPVCERKIKDALYRAASDPRAIDRGLLRWSTEQEEHPEYAFAGVVGLEKLGETGEDWRARLRRLAVSSDTSSRLLACAALVRHSEPAFLAPIELAARTFPDTQRDHETDHEQGLALRLLGELDPDRYFGLMQAVLLQRLPEDHNGFPEQEAAFVLARTATPEAVTTLIRGYFTASDYLRRVLRHYLPAAVARLEGREAPLVNQIDLWRYARIPP